MNPLHLVFFTKKNPQSINLCHPEQLLKLFYKFCIKTVRLQEFAPKKALAVKCKC